MAFPYHPDPHVTIETEYAAAASFQATGPKTWQVRASREQGAIILNVYSAGTETPFCTLTIPEAGAPGRIVLTEPRGRLERSSDNGLFIQPGYPAPVNILPLHQPEPEKFYDEKRTAGGRVFVRRYRVLVEPVSWETALKNGWIKEASDPNSRDKQAARSPAPSGDKYPESFPDTRTLRMVTVEDDTRTMVVRQLWREGDSWWTYEETLFKHSRRVE